MNYFSERLKEERERLGLSQAALGELCGVKKLAQFNYEKGERSPDAEYLAALSDAGADVQYILTGHRSMPALCVEQERAGYVVEVLSPQEANALRMLRASGALQGGDAAPKKIKQTSSGNANVMVGINSGKIQSEKVQGDSGSKRKR